MTVENIEANLRENKLDSIYLFYGEEKYLLENCVKKIKKIFGELVLGINYIQINESNIETLIPNIETPAFGFEKKLIIAKDTGLFKKGKKMSQKSIMHRVGATQIFMPYTIFFIWIGFNLCQLEILSN